MVVNIVCPLCGAQNKAIELPVEYDGGPRVYCCLGVIGATRCETLFTVTIIGTHLDRSLTPEELERLPPRPRDSPYYGIRTESDYAHAMWEVVERDSGRSLYRFGTEDTANAVARLLNRERDKWVGGSSG